MSRRPTIIDVAREAGVSKSTVSLVLRNGGTIRPETRQHVRDVMARLGYSYNRSAATLRSSGSGLIGLVINDLRNPFFTEFATSLQMALATHGLATVIANTDESPELQAGVIAAMIEHRVSAVIISAAYGGGSEAFDMLREARIPVMQVLRKTDPRSGTFPFAAPDYAEGGRLAACHLLDAGCRRIAFVGGIAAQGVTRERMSGYLAELRATGHAPLHLPGRASRNFGEEAAKILLRDHADVDGAICFNDLVALGLLSGLAKCGQRADRGIRVVGFDGIDECVQSYPSLSSISCGIASFGQQVAGMIVGWLQEGRVPPAELRTPVALVTRESSGRQPRPSARMQPRQG